MTDIPEQDATSPAPSIEALRHAWLGAIRGGDVGRLADLVTDDVVLSNGTGRCVRGREELRADFPTCLKAGPR